MPACLRLAMMPEHSAMGLCSSLPTMRQDCLSGADAGGGEAGSAVVRPVSARAAKVIASVRSIELGIIQCDDEGRRERVRIRGVAGTLRTRRGGRRDGGGAGVFALR